MRDLGWMSVDRFSAAAGSRKQGNRKQLERIEKTTYVETKTVTTPDGGEVELRLIAKGGRIGLGEINETGERVFVPFERARTHRNAVKGGTFRWYDDYRLPARGRRSTGGVDRRSVARPFERLLELMGE